MMGLAPALVLILCAGPAQAQEARGQVTGRVVDNQGLVLPGVVVEATNANTGVKVAVTTNAQGSYSIPYLNPGPYVVSFTLDGFKPVRRIAELRVADRLSVDASLEVGGLAETIEVAAGAALLDVQTSSLGQVVDLKRIQELPLRERNPWELVLLAPGVANTTNLRFRKAGATGAQSTFETDGSGDRRADFSIDGAPNMSSDQGTGGPTVAFAPPASAVQEFRVQTASFDAASGNVSGSVVNVVSKSGSNKIRGSADYYARSSKLDLQNVFEARAGQNKKPYKDSLFGASVGGPVRQSKTFYFVAFEGNPYGVPKSYPVLSVPTEKMRRGDFSDLLALGPQYQIYDPATTRPDPSTPGRYIRDPLPGNVIPANRLDPWAVKLLSFMLQPNAVGRPDGGDNYVSPDAVEEQSRYVVTGRVDHNFTANHRAFLRLSIDQWTNAKDQYFPNEAFGYSARRRNRQFAADDTLVLSSALVLNSRVSYIYQAAPQGALHTGFDLGSLGFAQSVVGLYDKETSTFPQVEIGPGFTFMRSASDVVPGGGVNGFEDYRTDIVSAGATLNWMKGRHAVRLGPEVRVFGEHSKVMQSAPTLTFGTTYTRGPRDNSIAAPYGQELGAFMMGYLTGGTSYLIPQRDERVSRIGLFIQDDWRLTNTLTLNVGLRYEYEAPLVEGHDAMVNGFDFATPLPIDAQARTNYAAGAAKDMPGDVVFRVQGGMLFAGMDGRSTRMHESIPTNLMPRVGLAYVLNSKTVLRGGWGMYYDSLTQGTLNAIQAGYQRATPVIPSLDNGVTFRATPANPFPGGLLAPVGSSLGRMTDVGIGVSFPFYGDVSAPLTHKFSAGFQRELWGDLKLEATYVGTRQFNQAVPRDLNATPAKYLSTSPTRDQTTINYLTTNLPNPFFGISGVTAGLTGQTISREQLLRPYPQFTSIQTLETIGRRWYNSAQVSLERRFKNGFTAQGAYTYSRLMEAVRYLNPSDTELHKVIGASDKPHVLVMSGVAELPFGKGRRFGTSWGGVTEQVLGGWQLGLFYRAQSGAPLAFGNFLLKPGYTVSDIPKTLSQDALFAGLAANAAFTNPWFNTAAFETGAQLANNIRTQPLRFAEVRAPGYSLFDASLSKVVSFTGTVKLKLRFQCFNLLNRINLLAPATAPTRSDFGSITRLNGYPRQFQLGATFEF